MNIMDPVQTSAAAGSAAAPSPSSAETGTGKAEKSEGNFMDMLEDAFNSVNRQINHSGDMIQKMASGEDVDISDTMIAISKAGISFRMMLQVRNKALSAYEEMMRMQV